MGLNYLEDLNRSSGHTRFSLISHDFVKGTRAMKIISFIEDDATIKKILKHCGKWSDTIPRLRPQIVDEPAAVAEDVTLDYDFFEQNCI